MDSNMLLEDTVIALSKKEDLVCELLRLTEEGCFTGTLSEVDAYVEYIDKRQEVIDVIDKLDIVITQNCKHNSIAANVEIKNKINSIKKTIEKIIAVDDNIRSNMTKLLDDVSSRLRARNAHRTAQTQYKNSANQYGAFLDLRN